MKKTKQEAIDEAKKILGRPSVSGKFQIRKDMPLNELLTRIAKVPKEEPKKD
jgi:hypothetical protein